MRQSQYTAQRKQINMDNELAELRELFATIEDKRAKNASHKLDDIFMSGFAMFNLRLNYDFKLLLKAQLKRIEPLDLVF
jgi:hypothetical protein